MDKYIRHSVYKEIPQEPKEETYKQVPESKQIPKQEIKPELQKETSKHVLEKINQVTDVKQIPKQDQKRIQENDPPNITGCFGCSWRKMLDFGYGIFSIARFSAQIAVGQKTSDEIRAKREEICRNCHLFTTVKDGVFSCGTLVMEKPLRVRKTEGCGCWLNLKWLGVSEKCPLEPPKW